VTCGDSLLEDLPTDTTRRREYRELHLSLHARLRKDFPRLVGSSYRRAQIVEKSVGCRGIISKTGWQEIL
jgi:hypothetical protein